MLHVNCGRKFKTTQLMINYTTGWNNYIVCKQRMWVIKQSWIIKIIYGNYIELHKTFLIEFLLKGGQLPLQGKEIH